jgi:hypothetical protein
MRGVNPAASTSAASAAHLNSSDRNNGMTILCNHWRDAASFGSLQPRSQAALSGIGDIPPGVESILSRNCRMDFAAMITFVTKGVAKATSYGTAYNASAARQPRGAELPLKIHTSSRAIR